MTPDEYEEENRKEASREDRKKPSDSERLRRFRRGRLGRGYFGGRLQRGERLV